jgi:hypothetical protein
VSESGRAWVGDVGHDVLNPSEGGTSVQDVSSGPRRSTRIRSFLKNLNDYIIEGKVKFGLEKVVNYSNLSAENLSFVTILNKIVEPKHFFQAVRDPNWVSAMNDEIEALNRNNTWELVDLPPGIKTVGCKWVHKIKYKSTSEVEDIRLG